MFQGCNQLITGRKPHSEKLSVPFDKGARRFFDCKLACNRIHGKDMETALYGINAPILPCNRVIHHFIASKTAIGSSNEPNTAIGLMKGNLVRQRLVQ